MMPVELYTDGSCIKNPGMGGYAYIIRYWEDPGAESGEAPVEKTLEVNQGFRLTTNNRMEIMAAVEGLRNVMRFVKDGTFSELGQIKLWSDSEYFVKAVNSHWIQKWQQNNWMTSGWKDKKPSPVKNKDLWEQVLEVQNELRNMNINLVINHVKGHNGHEFNERADQLAVSASLGNNHLIDEVYEKTMTVYNK